MPFLWTQQLGVKGASANISRSAALLKSRPPSKRKFANQVTTAELIEPFFAHVAWYIKVSGRMQTLSFYFFSLYSKKL